MPITQTLNGRVHNQVYAYPYKEDNLELPIPEQSDDWSDVTKDLIDSMPQVWTRGMLYFLVIFVSIVLPWAILFQVDETGTARGRLEPKGKTVRLDAAVSGTVAEIRVKEGEYVEAGQSLLVLDSDLVKAELRQIRDKLEGQLNRVSLLNSSKNQLVVSLTTQEQQNQAQQLEKQAQIDQVRHNLNATKNTYYLQQEEKLAQVNQARKALEHSQTASKLIASSLASAQREVERYRQLWQQGAIPEISLVEKQDIAKEQQKLYQQSLSDIQQAKLRLAEQQSSYERTIRQANADIEQAKLRLKEQDRSYQTLNRSGKLSLLRIEEQQQNLEREISTLQAEISQTKRQIESLEIQLSQRELKAPVSGTVFQLPIQKAGSVVQPGTMVAEIAPKGSPLIIRARMATNESGSLQEGLPVKLKFDAYPFQDYGILEGKLVAISPTTTELDTPNGTVAAYDLEVVPDNNCIPSGNKCVPLRPGDTATAEVIVRQRRIIDFLVDPFKQLQNGGLKL